MVEVTVITFHRFCRTKSKIWLLVIFDRDNGCFTVTEQATGHYLLPIARFQTFEEVFPKGESRQLFRSLKSESTTRFAGVASKLKGDDWYWSQLIDMVINLHALGAFTEVHVNYLCNVHLI